VLSLVTVRHPHLLNDLVLPAAKEKPFFVPPVNHARTGERHEGAAQDSGKELPAGYLTGKELIALLRMLEQSHLSAAHLSSPSGNKIEIGVHDAEFANLSMDAIIIAISKMGMDRTYGISGWNNPGDEPKTRKINLLVFPSVNSAPHKMRDRMKFQHLDIKVEIADGKPFITEWKSPIEG
jgi:hypothetical protein